MEILRRAANPWGQEVLLGVGWDLLWLAVGVGVVFMIVHTLLVRRLPPEGSATAGAAGAAGVPERIVRHNLASRLFHWSMAAAMLTLLVTAFVPVLGLKFDWVTIHWVAGLVLIATVLYHIIHSVFFQNFWAVWVEGRDVQEGMRQLRHVIVGGEAPSDRAGKYPVANKLFHHGAAILTLTAAVTGVVMMVRINTPIFRQNQYLFQDATWGYVYVFHGLAGVALVLMVIGHVYFAVRPEKWWQTRSMIRGWITREEYVRHHDPERWVPGQEPRQTPRPEIVGVPSGPGQAVEP